MHDLSELINDAFAREDWQGAIVLLKKELKSHRHDHWLLDRLSTAYYEERDYKRALHYIRRAHALAPKCPLVLWDLAGSLYSVGQIKAALRIYRDLVKKGPEKIGNGPHGEGFDWAAALLVDCVYRLGTCLQELGHDREALAMYRKFIDLLAWKRGIHTFEDAAKRIQQLSSPDEAWMTQAIQDAKDLLPV